MSGLGHKLRYGITVLTGTCAWGTAEPIRTMSIIDELLAAVESKPPKLMSLPASPDAL